MSKNGDNSAPSFVDTDHQFDIGMVQFEEVDEKAVESEVNVQKFDPEEAKHGLAGWVLGGLWVRTVLRTKEAFLRH